nr:MAG TPA: hypothetical protein [Caudoviricetes sp.]DAW46265.1 MAG TPA: hypothetical protein [Bacteriophage sp.]
MDFDFNPHFEGCKSLKQIKRLRAKPFLDCLYTWKEKSTIMLSKIAIMRHKETY